MYKVDWERGPRILADNRYRPKAIAPPDWRVNSNNTLISMNTHSSGARRCRHRV